MAREGWAVAKMGWRDLGGFARLRRCRRWAAAEERVDGGNGVPSAVFRKRRTNEHNDIERSHPGRTTQPKVIRGDGGRAGEEGGDDGGAPRWRNGQNGTRER